MHDMEDIAKKKEKKLVETFKLKTHYVFYMFLFNFTVNQGYVSNGFFYSVHINIQFFNKRTIHTLNRSVIISSLTLD